MQKSNKEYNADMQHFKKEYKKIVDLLENCREEEAYILLDNLSNLFWDTNLILNESKASPSVRRKYADFENKLNELDEAIQIIMFDIQHERSKAV